MGDIGKWFNRAEFACKCGCGADGIAPMLVAKLDLLRDMYGRAIQITSGMRCIKHNEAEGGKRDSAHLSGLAVDIACNNSHDRFSLDRYIRAVGFTRIGFANTFIHVDIDYSKPQYVLWLY